MKVKVKTCKLSLIREIFFIIMISPSSPTPPLSPLPSPIPSYPPVRHGICNECMEIVLVKYYFTGGKEVIKICGLLLIHFLLLPCLSVFHNRKNGFNEAKLEKT